MFKILTMVSLTTGTMFIMWLGEQITEFGVGNGISLIIMIGILARFPNSLITEGKQVIAGNQKIFVEIFLLALMVAVVAVIILITQGHRNIPVQYAKRIIGRKVYGGQNTHIPLRLVTAGVIPIIFAQSLMFLPSTISTFFPNNPQMQLITSWFSIDSSIYWLFYALLIVFFTYFYTAIIFNPIDLADNMRKQGGFIPGIRPGKKTSDYIDNILTRITLPGAIFLALIAIFPYFLVKTMNISYSFSDFFGGTGMLIVVGVALDTLQQIESQLLIRHYDGFLKKGHLKGRKGI
jgi:preprotein translocase subunit SecY